MNPDVFAQQTMCDRPRIHVFLGAPPPSSDIVSLPGSGLEADELPHAQWSQVELTWVDGHLRPATGEVFRDPNGKNIKTIFNM